MSYRKPYEPYGWVPQSVIKDIEARFHGFPVPDMAIDPVTATPDELRRFGLPPKPSSGAPPLLQKVWNQAFGRVMQIQAFKVEPNLIEATQFRLFEKAVANASFDGLNFEASSNWSGAYITANRDRRFLQLWGTWTIPGDLQLPPPGFQGPLDIPYMCANWIGLDGQRRYLDSSLPQMGTVSILQPDGTTTADSWIQWWARGSGNTAPVPLALAVAPGDTVACVLTAESPISVWAVMVNLSSSPPTAVSIKMVAPMVTLPDGSSVQPQIAGATAEWIVERPKVPPQPNQPPNRYNFPDYGQSGFDFCLAVEGHSVDIASLLTGIPQDLTGARRIRMFEVLENPTRTQYISMVRKLDNLTLQTNYGSF
jgi:hypothetical protein